MATSGLVKTNEDYDSYFWVKWSQIGNQDIANNRTQISWSCGLTSSHKFYSNAIKMSAFYINGTMVYGGGTYSNFTAEGEQQIASGTLCPRPLLRSVPSIPMPFWSSLAWTTPWKRLPSPWAS